MKRQWRIAVLMLAILLGLSSSATAVTAAPAAKPSEGWSSITIWALTDNDANGVFNAGDGYLHEISACLTHKQAHQTFCGGTDYGDVWWEPNVGGTFVTWLDAKDVDIPTGYTLNAITCYNSGILPKGKLCSTRFNKWEAPFKQVARGAD